MSNQDKQQPNQKKEKDIQLRNQDSLQDEEASEQDNLLDDDISGVSTDADILTVNEEENDINGEDEENERTDGSLRK